MNVPEVTVIDYDVGNILSVQRGLEHCGAKVTLTVDPEQILAAEAGRPAWGRGVWRCHASLGATGFDCRNS